MVVFLSYFDLICVLLTYPVVSRFEYVLTSILRILRFFRIGPVSRIDYWSLLKEIAFCFNFFPSLNSKLKKKKENLRVFMPPKVMATFPEVSVFRVVGYILWKLYDDFPRPFFLRQNEKNQLKTEPLYILSCYEYKFYLFFCFLLSKEAAVCVSYCTCWTLPVRTRLLSYSLHIS